MSRRKKILFLVASLIAFGMGFLSTTLRRQTARDSARAPARLVQVYTR